MEIATITSLAVELISNAPTIAARALNASEPVWLAVWGVALLTLHNAARHSVPEHQDRRQRTARNSEASPALESMGGSFARPA